MLRICIVYFIYYTRLRNTIIVFVFHIMYLEVRAYAYFININSFMKTRTFLDEFRVIVQGKVQMN